MKVTPSRRKKSIDFFKSEATKHHTQYHRMIRRPPDACVDAQAQFGVQPKLESSPGEGACLHAESVFACRGLRATHRIDSGKQGPYGGSAETTFTWAGIVVVCRRFSPRFGNSALITMPVLLGAAIEDSANGHVHLHAAVAACARALERNSWNCRQPPHRQESGLPRDASRSMSIPRCGCPAGYQRFCTKPARLRRPMPISQALLGRGIC